MIEVTEAQIKTQIARFENWLKTDMRQEIAAVSVLDEDYMIEFHIYRRKKITKKGR